jgi:hypothetical protein
MAARLLPPMARSLEAPSLRFRMRLAALAGSALRLFATRTEHRHVFEVATVAGRPGAEEPRYYRGAWSSNRRFPASFFHWKFRLLRAILLNSRRAEGWSRNSTNPCRQVRNLLHCAQTVLEGQAASILGHGDRRRPAREAHRAAEAPSPGEVRSISRTFRARALRSKRYDDAKRGALERARALGTLPEASVLVTWGDSFNRHRHEAASSSEASRLGPHSGALFLASLAAATLVGRYDGPSDPQRWPIRARAKFTSQSRSADRTHT